MEYLIDMSEFFSMMQAFSDSKQTEEMQIDQSFLEAKEALKSVKGISGISITGNSRNYIFGIKFNFTDVNALNEAMSCIFQQEYSGLKYISFSGRKITRHGVISEDFSQEKLIGDEKTEFDEEMMQGIFEQMKYKVSMEFQRPVKSVNTNAEYEISGKSVKFETDFAKFLDNNKNLETIINLR